MRQVRRASMRPAMGLLCLLLAFPLTQTTVEALELDVAGDRVQVTDDSGSEVAIIGARREFANSMNVVHRHQEVVSRDLVLESEVGSRSIWVGIDLGSGEWTVHSPGDIAQVKRYAADISGPALRSLDRLELPGEELDLIVIRRGGQVRVWHGRIYDGGTGDESESDGWLVADNAKLRRVDQGQGNLARFEDGDVVIGFDATTLEYFVVEVGATDEGGAS